MSSAFIRKFVVALNKEEAELLANDLGFDTRIKAQELLDNVSQGKPTKYKIFKVFVLNATEVLKNTAKLTPKPKGVGDDQKSW